MSSSKTIFPIDYSVTGIRSLNSTDNLVIITGSCPPPTNSSSRVTPGLIYSGPVIPKDIYSSACSWNPADSTGCLCVLPQIQGQTPVTAVFYGPDTTWFTPELNGDIRVVGSYRLTATGYDHGVKYQGPLTVEGLANHNNWEKIVMDPDKVTGTVANTILHSTMGDLIVGNYDLEGSPGSGNAFIYQISTRECFDLKTLLPDESKFVTAYGIWKNDITDQKDGTAYTIAGGLWTPGVQGFNAGFLVDVDISTTPFTVSNLTPFSYGNELAHLTHFEGITRNGTVNTKYGPAQYSLAATGDKHDVNRGAAFAVVSRDPDDGSFIPIAKWTPVAKPNGASFITGNTVLQSFLYGIYPATGQTFRSYIADLR